MFWNDLVLQNKENLKREDCTFFIIIILSTICIHNKIYGISEISNCEYKGICKFYKDRA